MSGASLQETARALVAEGKGILAADEKCHDAFLMLREALDNLERRG